jgi:hypothetical protein
MSEHLEPLRFLVGKTWRGTFSASTAERPMHDTLTVERALNGQALRLLHSINDGEYGGETIVMYGRAEEQLIYYYFTTAGFYTRGVIEPTAGGYRSTEAVTGSEHGTTEVAATTTRIDAEHFTVSSRYLQNGEWVPGHEVSYELSPDAQVVFR